MNVYNFAEENLKNVTKYSTKGHATITFSFCIHNILFWS